MPGQNPIIAHRGACTRLPENTIAALQLAHEMGSSWVEIDVQVTHDGGLVVMHDHWVDRTTTGQGPVAMMQLDDILALKALDPKTQQPTRHAIPTLCDVVALCTQLSLGLVLEIKATWGIDSDNGKAIAAALPSTVAFPLVVTSFSVRALLAFGAARPDIALGLACLKSPRDPAKARDDLRLSAIHCNAAFVSAADTDAIHAAGLECVVATVNDAKQAQIHLDMGVDAVMSDLPDLMASKYVPT